MFGKWFLEEAKTKYSTTFTSYNLGKIIDEIKIDIPEHKIIKCNTSDYEKCRMLREIGVNGDGCCGSYKSSYVWYTLWQITKAYNGKHGCIVTEPPHREYMRGNLISITLDWSQDAVDCISGDKWLSKDDKSLQGVCSDGMCGVLVWFFVWIVWCLIELFVSGEFIGFKSMIIPIVPFFMLFAFPVHKYLNEIKEEQFSSDFKKHCKNIEETKFSKFSVEHGKIVMAGYM